jgi:hypothetical protein
VAFDPVTAVFGVAEKLIERIWPDPTQRAQAAQAMAKLRQDGDLAFLNADLALMTGQLEINKMEAQHGGLFKGGWRPAVGWICASALAYHFVLHPFLISGVQIAAHFMDGVHLFPIEELPDLQWQELSTLLFGMLGIGGMRTYEKHKTERLHNG